MLQVRAALLAGSQVDGALPGKAMLGFNITGTALLKQTERNTSWDQAYAARQLELRPANRAVAEASMQASVPGLGR